MGIKEAAMQSEQGGIPQIEVKTDPKKGYLGRASDGVMSYAVRHPIQSVLVAGVVTHQVSERAVSPALDWLGGKAVGLFKRGAGAAAEQAASGSQETAKNLVGGLVAVLGKIGENLL